jgi:hypothetical protein
MRSIVKAVEAEIRRQSVRAILKYGISTKTYVNYVPLAKALGLFSGGIDLATILGEIMEEDHKNGGPLTCSVLVGSQSGMPGKGFFEMAKKLGYQVPDDQAFWKAQTQALGMP